MLLLVMPWLMLGLMSRSPPRLPMLMLAMFLPHRIEERLKLAELIEPPSLLEATRILPVASSTSVSSHRWGRAILVCLVAHRFQSVAVIGV